MNLSRSNKRLPPEPKQPHPDLLPEEIKSDNNHMSIAHNAKLDMG